MPVTCAAFINKQVSVGTINGLFIYDKKTTNTQTVVAPDEVFREEIFGIFPLDKNIIYSKTNSISNISKPFIINDFSHDIDTFHDLELISDKLENFSWPLWFKVPNQVLWII